MLLADIDHERLATPSPCFRIESGVVVRGINLLKAFFVARTPDSGMMTTLLGIAHALA